MSHLVLNARLEVTQEGDRLIVLDFAILNRRAAQKVIQLGGKDGGSSHLILGALAA